MPSRWVINPVTQTGNTRRAKASTLVDPGIPPVEEIQQEEDEFGNPVGPPIPVTVVKNYLVRNTISDGQFGQVNDWCLSLVTFVDPASLNSDPEIIDLFEDDFSGKAEAMDGLKATPRGRGWDASRLGRIRAKMQGKGASIQGLGLDTSIKEWLRNLRDVVSPRDVSFD